MKNRGMATVIVTDLSNARVSEGIGGNSMYALTGCNLCSDAQLVTVPDDVETNDRKHV